MLSQSIVTLLPVEVHRFILGALTPSEPIFIPRYQSHTLAGERHHQHPNCYPYGDLTTKHQEYYGPQNRGRDEAAAALLSLSSTCSFYRELLAPSLFRTVVLRSRPKSLASVRSLMQTSHWQSVERFMFASTFPEPQSDDDHDPLQWPDPLESIDVEDLWTIMSNLPPNMSELVLDFPSNWTSKLTPNHCVFDHRHSVRDAKAKEATEPFRAMLQTVFLAIADGQQYYHGRPPCSLRINNMPAFRCSVFHTEIFQRYLGSLRSFSMGLCHFDFDGALRMMRQPGAHRFAGTLDDMFLIGLVGVENLEIHGDISWPLAERSANYPDVCLPRRYTYMGWEPVLHRLKSIKLTYFYITYNLKNFLVLHAQTLETIDLTACCVPGACCVSHGIHQLTWAGLFSALSDRKPLRLVSFEVRLAPEQGSLDTVCQQMLNGQRVTQGPVAEEAEDIALLLRLQSESLRQLKGEDPVEYKKDYRRRRQVFPYLYISDTYGGCEVRHDYPRINKRFLEQSDHREWVRLIDIMERNEARMALEETQRSVTASVIHPSMMPVSEIPF